MVTAMDKEFLAKMLHEWYLEATANLDPESFNPEAQKPFEELNYGIDRWRSNQK